MEGAGTEGAACCTVEEKDLDCWGGERSRNPRVRMWLGHPQGHQKTRVMFQDGWEELTEAFLESME